MNSVQQISGEGYFGAVSGGYLGEFGVGVTYSSGYYGITVNGGLGVAAVIYGGKSQTATTGTWRTWGDVAKSLGLKDGTEAFSKIKDQAIAILDKNINDKTSRIEQVQKQIEEKKEKLINLSSSKKTGDSDIQKIIQKESNQINQLGKELDKLTADKTKVEDIKKQITEMKMNDK